jgi:ribosome-associated protein
VTEPALPATTRTRAASKTAAPAKPAKTAAPVKAAAPAKIVKPARATVRAKPVKAAAPAKTAAPAKSANPAAPAKPAKSTRPVKPAKLATAAAVAPGPMADGLPRRDGPAPKAERPPLELARRIVDLAEDKKAADIVLLDLTSLTTLADYFVICSGGSERQLDAIADGIVAPLRDERTKPYGREGTPASHWVLLDFGSVVVHIFTPPERDYYGLEKHWSEARTVVRVQ